MADSFSSLTNVEEFNYQRSYLNQKALLAIYGLAKTNDNYLKGFTVKSIWRPTTYNTISHEQIDQIRINESTQIEILMP